MLWYYDDAGNFVRTGNIKIDGNLSGTNNIALQGTAYSNLENNVKVVQCVPAGGKMYLGVATQTGAIKIKLPKSKSSAIFKFKVKMNGYSTGGKQSNSEYIVKGHNVSTGFDWVRVGVGPGSQCLTRNVTGVGRNQLNALQDCRKIDTFLLS